MATGVFSPGRAKIEQKTLRSDNWRKSPLLIAGILIFFILYATVRIFMRKWYWSAENHYLTPLYSPCVTSDCQEGSSHLGTWFGSFPVWIPIPIITFLVLAGFRGTCYYYRKAGWRSLLFAPQGCAVPEPHKKYTGESRFPLSIVNFHRFFFYAACLFALLNLYDAILAFKGRDGGFGMGLGTLIICINLVFLVAYTLSCHACRHVMGGRLRNFSKHPLRYRFWTFLSKINPKHGDYAMISLFTVIFTDFYIMAVSAGWFSDPRFFN